MSTRKHKYRITVPRTLETLMRNYCVYSYPVERAFFLIGTSNDSGVTIEHIWHPDNWYRYCKPDKIFFPVSWEKEAAKFAKEMGMDVVGTVHSHTYESEDVENPFNYSTPSEDDFKNFSCYPVLGICTVVRDIGGKMRSKVKLYPTRAVEVVRS